MFKLFRVIRDKYFIALASYNSYNCMIYTINYLLRLCRRDIYCLLFELVISDKYLKNNLRTNFSDSWMKFLCHSIFVIEKITGNKQKNLLIFDFIYFQYLFNGFKLLSNVPKLGLFWQFDNQMFDKQLELKKISKWEGCLKLLCSSNFRPGISIYHSPHFHTVLA